MLRVMSVSLSLSLLALSLTGCETVDEVSTLQCIETKTVLTLDEASALGYSAQSILEQFEGTYTEPMTWTDGGGSDVTVSLTYEGGNLYFVDAELEEMKEGEIYNDIYIECPDFMLVEASLTVNSEDGRLAESADVSLLSYNGEAAHALFSRTPEALQGTLEPLSVASEWDDISFSITAFFSTEGHEGSVNEIASRSGDEDDETSVAEAQHFERGSWPGELF